MAHISDYTLARIRQRMGENIPLPPKPRKRRDNPEHRAQRSLIEWWDHAAAGFGIPRHLLFAIPNGGWRDPVGAKKLKDEGQRNGVSDLFLSVPRGGFHGAYVEMKAPDGVVSDDQEAFMEDASAQGYAVRVCYSVESAMGFIRGYLEG